MRMHRFRLPGAALLIALLAPVAAGAQSRDEANRQSMMADMRASAARNDQLNVDSQQRLQARNDSYSATGNGSGRGTSANSTTSGVPNWAPAPYRPSGPRSIVATYEFTIHRQESPQDAATRLQAEAGAGNVRSAYDAARILYTGYGGVAKDDAAAARLFGAAARGGLLPAQAQYGYMLAEGIGAAADPAEGYRWLKTAADAGESYGQAIYGYYLLRDELKRTGAALPDAGVIARAVGYLTKGADAGHVAAQGALGTIVYRGLAGLPTDWVKAAHYDKLAADQGYAPATAELGQLMVEGRGVAMDRAAGVALVSRAAATGNAHAMSLMGDYAAQGIAMPRDMAVAVGWWRKAADKGDGGAAGNYAVMLFTGGGGLTQDLTAGARYALQSAKAGEVGGQVAIAKAYYFGTGVALDYGQALYWFRLATAQGNAEAVEALKDDAMVKAASAAPR